MKTFLSVSVLTLSLIFAGCEAKPGSGDNTSNSSSSADTSAGGNTDLAGSIKIEGSSTVEPISIKAKEGFNKLFPNVNVSISGQGTGNGFKALAKQEADVSDASRPIKAKEFDACIAAGVRFVEIPVAYDGLTVVVNKENTFIEQLTVDQLKKIFREDLAAKTWKDVDPSWPDEKISLFIPGTASGTHDYFVEVVGKDDDKGLRSGDGQTQPSEDDKVLVTGVEGDRNAIAFFGFSFYEANNEDLKAIPIVNPKTDTAVTPSRETIESGEYAPFSRPLFIYVNMDSYDKLEVQEFVDYYLENAAELAKAARYVPLPDSVYEMARDNLDDGAIGTHYLDADGEKRPGGVVSVLKPENLRSE